MRRQRLDRYSRTSIQALVAVGPADAIVLVSHSFREPSQFYRLHLPNSRWLHLEGAGCRVSSSGAVLPAPGGRVVVLGGIECKTDSSGSDHAAHAAFVLGPLRRWRAGPPAAGSQRYPAYEAPTAGAPVAYRLRRCTLNSGDLFDHWD